MFKVLRTDMPQFHGLFKNYYHQVSVSSVLEGNLGGLVFVDELSDPQAGVLFNSEGAFIAGNPSNDDFNSKLSQYLEDIIQTKKHPVIDDTDDLWFYVDDPEWVKQYPKIFISRDPFRVGRQYFKICLPARNWRDLLPDGYQIHRADQTFSVDSFNFPGDVWEWIDDSLCEYLERGFGAVLTSGDNVVCWSNADCSYGERCEIGIITTEDERRKGYGNITVLAALDYCHQSGFKEVGWHCEAHNWGSIATAEKVGFKKCLEYNAWVCKFDLNQHVKEKKIVEKHYP